jgi:long-chain acyl-CoA synthetase
MTARTVPEALSIIFQKYHDEIAFVDKQAFRRQTWTYGQTAAHIDEVVAYLQSRNLASGDCVALCAPNSPWWLTVYLACAKLGVVIVPLDFNSSAEFIDTVLLQTDAQILFKSVYKVYEGSVATVILEDMPHIVAETALESTALTQLPTIDTDQTLEIVFTSGSTGTPKGVMLSHSNVMSNVANFLEAWPKQKHQTSLSLVPLSHMLEQTVGFWAPFSLGYTIVYIASLRPTVIAETLKQESVTCIITVPAFLQLLRRRMLSQIDERQLRGKLALALMRTAARLPRNPARLLTSPIRAQLGSKLETLAVGGAALPAEVEDFWAHLGYTIVQGYGLTETSPLATYSSRLHQKPRSVGKGLPNQDLKIESNGELLLRGSHVFKGYYNNDSATQQVLDNEGWFHTGDIAEIDADGFVFLKGRLKNMLLTSNGLNIYPEDIEAKLLDFTEVRDAVVLMDTRGEEPVLTAVVLTTESQDVIKKVVAQVNQTLASHQTLQNSIVWPDSDFPRTATRKIRRQAVQTAIDNQVTDALFIPSHDTNVIHEVIRQVSAISSDITDNLILASDLAIDSIKRLELVTLLEEKLLVSIEETAINQSTTVGQLSSMIEAARVSTGKHKTKQIRDVTNNWFLLAVQSAIQGMLLFPVAYYQRLSVSNWTPTLEPVLYVANHTSHLDAPTFLRLAGFQGRQKLVVAAAADYFFSNKFTGWLSRNIMHAIPVERDGSVRASLERIGNELSQGRSVIIFPEGSRSKDGSLTSFKPGVGLLAASLQVPIIPIRLNGNYQVLPKGSRWPKRGVVQVVVGEPRSYSISQSPDDIAKDLQLAVQSL